MSLHYPLLGILPPSYQAKGPALVFADTETGGRRGGLRLPFLLDGRRIWDLALCRRNPDGSEEWLQAFVRLEDLPFNLDDPEQLALMNRYGRFDERHPQRNGAYGPVAVEAALAADVAHMFRPTSGLTGMDAKPVLIGCVPGFEDLGIGDLLRRHGLIDSEPPWHHHLLDAETAAAARLGIRPHWYSKDLSRALGVDPDAYDAHTARGDVEWAMALYAMAYAPRWVIWSARAGLRLRRLRDTWNSPQTATRPREAA
jgi:hypothetical protein